MAAEVRWPSAAVILSARRPFISVRLAFNRFSVSVTESIKLAWILSCSWAATSRNCSIWFSNPSRMRCASALKERTSASRFCRIPSISWRNWLSREFIIVWASSIVFSIWALYSSSRFFKFSERVETALLMRLSVASMFSVICWLFSSTSYWCWLIRSSKVVAKVEAVSSTCCSIAWIFSWIRAARASTSCWHWEKPVSKRFCNRSRSSRTCVSSWNTVSVTACLFRSNSSLQSAKSVSKVPLISANWASSSSRIAARLWLKSEWNRSIVSDSFSCAVFRAWA